ncbi:hypothetical protein CH352_10275 [Leptospira hartskeerlii]|uniref:Uncharacterized protein n=5 Tax=Leptospira TaxID=171 RepID=A0A2M9ZXB4_9LEPT|nr:MULTISPECIES: hypothetical protein [Leptospira]PJZ24954.1 hypothetical protein CH357_12080 [Leptospira hartskeerlii]PJZ33346.1 hypothetical protein CH352_10275 [Leptospira hartskeerlii]PJZ49894.1 hypothetical protein CH362_06120 [Leptospira saintgironsiae]PJZ76676.1 hypothetical protein CH365_11630 [Leptospira neocaledonica]PKA16962.1 hypothetical protein CH363_06125 [Leptospira haakeii]
MEKQLELDHYYISQIEEAELGKRIRNRALGREEFDFSPYSCFIEYKAKDVQTGIEYRDCVIDYTRCPNSRCIKKLL